MTQLGRYSHIGKDAVYYFDPEIEAGNFVAIADNVTFCGAMNYPWIIDRKSVNCFPFGTELQGDYRSGITRGKIIIGNDVWIGYKVVILDGVTIGDGAIIGAYSVVGKNIPPYAIVVGNPIVIKSYRFSPEQIEKLLQIKWWNWEDQKIKDNVKDFKNIDEFIKKYG